MRQPQLVSQGTVEKIVRAAGESWKNKNFESCIELLERATRLKPADYRILLQLGRVYGLRYDYGSAERCFEKAVSLTTCKSEALGMAGEHAMDFSNHNLAQSYFSRALKERDLTSGTLVRFAELHERLNRLSEAEDFIDRALKSQNSCASALLVKARLQRRAGHLNEAEHLLRTALSNVDKEVRIRGLYELGVILDRQGRYDEAMAALTEAKSMMCSEAVPLLAQAQVIRSHLKETCEKLTADTLAQWAKAASDSRPACRLAFLGGHARSGTTLLEQVLDAHPEIVSAEETSIFHDNVYIPLRRNAPPDSSMLAVLENALPDALQQSRRSYFHTIELHLGCPIGNRLLVDKNPSINFFIPAFIRVFPELKILVALRDPRDVCLSCFMQPHFPLSAGSVSYLSLESTVEAYGRVMGMWKTIAPMISNPRLEVRYEDMVNSLATESRRVLEFLNVEWDDRVLDFDKHARTKRVRSPTYADVVKPIFKSAMGRWNNYRKYFEPHLKKLAPFLESFGYE